MDGYDNYMGQNLNDEAKTLSQKGAGLSVEYWALLLILPNVITVAITNNDLEGLQKFWIFLCCIIGLLLITIFLVIMKGKEKKRLIDSQIKVLELQKDKENDRFKALKPLLENLSIENVAQFLQALQSYSHTTNKSLNDLLRSVTKQLTRD